MTRFQTANESGWMRLYRIVTHLALFAVLLGAFATSVAPETLGSSESNPIEEVTLAAVSRTVEKKAAAVRPTVGQCRPANNHTDSAGRWVVCFNQSGWLRSDLAAPLLC